MAIKKKFFCCALLVCVAAAYAQSQSDDMDFFYTLNDGVPVFTQIMRWTASEGALQYRLLIKNASDETLVDIVTKESEYEVRLQPGDYRRKIIVYNLLNQAETESDWIAFVVRKAGFPEIVNINPQKIYLDDAKAALLFLVNGYTPGTQLFFERMEPTQSSVPLEFREQDASTLEVTLADSAKFAGAEWFAKIVHPSGLSSVFPHAIAVQYKRPMHFYVGLGWTPRFVFTDEYYKSLWRTIFNPASAALTAGMIFYKSRYAYVGCELRAAFGFESVLDAKSRLTAYHSLNGLAFVYEYPVTQNWLLFARAGGGVVFSLYEFTHRSNRGRKTKSTDGFVFGGAGVRWRFMPLAYAEFGISWEHIFYRGFSSGALVPELGIGFRY